VQDAQRTLFTAQRQLIELQLQANVNLVNLYKALGGGWSEQNIVASVPPRSADGLGQSKVVKEQPRLPS
jgi:multidrug efflux system outer membrane protein